MYARTIPPRVRRISLVGLCCLYTASAGAAPVRRLAVLPSAVQGESGQVESHALFDALTKSAELRVGIELAGYNELFVDGADPIASSVFACGSDLPCISRTLRNGRIDLGLRAVVNFAVSPPLISLSLIEGSGILAEEIAELKGRALDDELRAASDALFAAAKIPKGGRLQVLVEPSDARVSAKDCTTGQMYSPDPRTTAQFTQLPGCVEIEATRELYTKNAARTELRAGEVTSVEMKLLPAETAEEESIFSSPWFWVITGGVVAAGTAAVLVATDPFGGELAPPTCFCVATPETACPPCP